VIQSGGVPRESAMKLAATVPVKIIEIHRWNCLTVWFHFISECSCSGRVSGGLR
jgi:hypothetical protein